MERRRPRPGRGHHRPLHLRRRQGRRRETPRRTRLGASLSTFDSGACWPAGTESGREPGGRGRPHPRPVGLCLVSGPGLIDPIPALDRVTRCFLLRCATGWGWGPHLPRAPPLFGHDPAGSGQSGSAPLPGASATPTRHHAPHLTRHSGHRRTGEAHSPSETWSRPLSRFEQALQRLLKRAAGDDQPPSEPHRGQLTTGD